MRLLENIISAFSVLRASKLRTILTLLGITIGIAGIIAMMSFGAGAEKLIMAEFEKIGGPSMFGVYRPGHIRKNGRWQRNTSPHHLEMEDLRDVLAECPSVEVATVEGSYYINLGIEGKFQRTYLRATTNEYQAVREWRTAYGRFLADTDMDAWTKVCVIGSKIWKEQFKGEDPIGKEVIINNFGNNKRFTVIGIMESRGDGLERGKSDDNMLFIPITTAQKRFWGHDNVGHIMVRAKSPMHVDQALKEVKTIITRNHGGDDTFFRTWSAKQGIAQAKRMILIIETVLVVIASVSLIVAGIGILNIMLVSVTERIPEIGLRKAVGAKSFNIRMQFLTESVILCLIGSLLGIALGAVAGKGFAWIVGKFLDDLAWPSVITPEAVLISVGAGAAVGIFFGFYPASQAAKMTPIDAIRHT
ncbi:FtsX-like permease family protein [Candidatus Poribacteria bacterium]|nr:FtsX-like permease family protein [Candidatus Poribacteria bacterium]MYA98446.1 FtsX-like permease family protein [Candidatus Poribacteria bacterium]